MKWLVVFRFRVEFGRESCRNRSSQAHRSELHWKRRQWMNKSFEFDQVEPMHVVAYFGRSIRKIDGDIENGRRLVLKLQN